MNQTPPLRILLVEDNEHDKLLLRRAFKKSQVSCEITECMRAEEAMRLLNVGSVRSGVNPPNFDLLVIDHGLPGISGLDLCKELVDEERPWALVLLTGVVSEQLAVEALKAGVDDYITKDTGRAYLELLPVLLTDVVRKHGDRMARKRAEEELRKHREHLEELVKERTSELRTINEQLQREIIERKQVEEALMVSAQQWRSTFDAITDSVCLLNKEGNILRCNKAMANLLGKSFSDIVGCSCWEVIYGTSEAIEECPLVRMCETRRRETTVWQMDDHWFNVAVDPIQDKDGNITGAVHIMSDISEQKYMEEQLRQSQKMEAVGKLAAGVAHEIGNPLTSISSLTQLLQMKSNDNFAKENLQLMRENIDRINKIVRNMVDFSRPASNERKFIQVKDVVKDAVNISKFDKRAKNIELITNLASNMRKIPLVADQLLQVFMNIIFNAFDAMPDGGELRISAKQKSEMIHISFTDTGTGINPDVASHIFDPFFTTKEVGKGVGLGLSVSYGIIKSLGGNIEVQSTEGLGSTFTVILPAENLEEKEDG